MKKKIRKIVCGMIALGMILQTQPVYATEKTIVNVKSETFLNEQLVSSQEKNESSQTQTGNETEEQNGVNNTDESDSGSQQHDASDQEAQEQPEEPDAGEEDQMVKPSALKGLHTTAQSKTKVCLEWNASKNATSYKLYRRQGSSEYKNIATTEETIYTDKEIKDNKLYHYKVVPQNQKNEEGTAGTIAFSNKIIVKFSSKRYTYGQMQSQMKALESKYSDYCELSVIGKTVQGRSIYDLAIGDPDADSSILVVGTLHAREYICAAVLMKEIEYYLSNYNHMVGGMKPANTLKHTQIHYIVMANPDGVTLSQNSYARWKSNARGVDLNRNFPTHKFVVGGKKGAEGYSGKKALSEPESRAVATLTQQLKKKQNLLGVVNYHAMGRIIYGSCSSKKLYKDTKTMYDIAQRDTGYARAYESSGKSASGGQYREYVMYMLGIPSITIEVGRSIAPCGYAEYETEFQKNKYVVLKIAKAIS